MKLAPLALLVVLAACQTARPVDPDVARREAYIEAHPETVPEVATAIRAGRIRNGMMFREAVASLGPPGRGPFGVSFRLQGPPDWWNSSWGDVRLTFGGTSLETAVFRSHPDWDGCPPGLIMP
jgi:hypothetical protein